MGSGHSPRSAVGNEVFKSQVDSLIEGKLDEGVD